MKKIVLLTMCLLALKVSSSASEKLKIAVADFKGIGVSKSLAKSVTEMIRTEIINLNSFIVLERHQMGEILKEQGFQQTGSTEISYAVKMGKILSARKMLIGSVTKVGDRIIINGRIVDVEKAISEVAQMEELYSENDIYHGVKNFTAKLTNRINKNSDTKAAKNNISKKTDLTDDKHDFIVMMGYDIVGRYNYELDDSYSKGTEATNKAFSFAFQYYYSLTSMISLGAGITYLPTRKADDEGMRGFSNFAAIPFYAAVRFKFKGKHFDPYLAIMVGASNMRTEPISKNGTTFEEKSGTYGGYALGAIMKNNIFIELTIDLSTTDITYKDYNYSPVVSNNYKISYARISLSAGHIF